MTQTSKKRPGGAKRGCCEGLGQLLSPRLFKSLSDPTRIGLVVAIADAKQPATVSELAKGRPIDLSVVSRHLRMLREAGVIECVKRGKELHCSLSKVKIVKSLRDLADELEACCGGQTDRVSGSTTRPKATSRSPRNR